MSKFLPVTFIFEHLAAIGLVETAIDAACFVVREVVQRAHGLCAENNFCPFIEHEHDVENLGGGLAECDRAVIFHEDDFGRFPVLFLEIPQRIADGVRQIDARVHVGNHRDMQAADDDGIGTEMTQKRLCALLAGKEGKDGSAVGVADPFRAALAHANGMEEGFDRGFFVAGIGEAIDETLLNVFFGQVFTLEDLGHFLVGNLGQPLAAEGAERGAGSFDEKGAIAHVGAGISLAQDGEGAIFFSKLP